MLRFEQCHNTANRYKFNSKNTSDNCRFEERLSLLGAQDAQRNLSAKSHVEVRQHADET